MNFSVNFTDGSQNETVKITSKARDQVSLFVDVLLVTLLVLCIFYIVAKFFGRMHKAERVARARRDGVHSDTIEHPGGPLNTHFFDIHY